MKNALPYHVVLVITLAATGLILYYNFVARDDYAMTLRYEFPPVEQVAREAEERETNLAETQRIQPDAEARREDAAEGTASQPELNSVQFPLDLNRATVEELKFIPQVGDVMAQRITQYRDYLGGRYDTLEQLREIKGVGDKTFENLRTYLYIPEEEPQYAGG